MDCLKSNRFSTTVRRIKSAVIGIFRCPAVTATWTITAGIWGLGMNN